MKPRPAGQGDGEQPFVGPMPNARPEPLKHTGALLVHGRGVPRKTFDMLSNHLERLISELDRAKSGTDTAQFDWRTLNHSYRGRRVLIAPDPRPEGLAARAASRILEWARRGIAVLTGGSRRPPMFTEVALGELEKIARVIDDENVSRLSFFAGGMQEEITRLTLTNLRALIQLRDQDS